MDNGVIIALGFARGEMTHEAHCAALALRQSPPMLICPFRLRTYELLPAPQNTSREICLEV